jgi:hypothetical protein
MKTKFLLFLPMILTIGIYSAKAQCINETFITYCAYALDDFNFIKSYEFENKKKGEKGEYSYLFSKGYTYRIVICDNEVRGSRMVITLYDKNHRVIVSNKHSNKYYHVITYPCSATGLYYVKYMFEGSRAKCAVNILGFAKQQ